MKKTDTIQDLQPDNTNRLSIRFFFDNSEQLYKFMDFLSTYGGETMPFTYQWLDNWESPKVCSHQWEHLHGYDKDNEFRCALCGKRK